MKSFFRQCTIGTLRTIGHLPLSWLYVLSTMIRPFVQYAIGYRRSVVQTNLLRSFPAESSEWRARVERRFYAFLCDYAVETLRFSVMGEEEMKQRMQFVGIDSVREALDNQEIGILFLGHYGNWEWVSSLPLWAKSVTHCGQLYKHLRAEAIDRFFLEARSRFGSENIDKNDALRRILQLKQQGKRSLIGFITDQCPRVENIHCWIPFLHQDTPVFTGAERIARKVKAAVFFVHIARPERGRYVCTFRPLATAEEISTLPEHAITERYMAALEEMIKEVPHLWLWSHKRWKHQRDS